SSAERRCGVRRAWGGDSRARFPDWGTDAARAGPRPRRGPRSARRSTARSSPASLLKAVFTHPPHVARGAGVEVLRRAAAADRGAHLVAGQAVEAAVAQAAEERRVVDEAGAERH